MTETFSFIRFAEYRPSTFTADFTIEIPTLAQQITDETIQPIKLVVWLELTSLTLKHVNQICSRLEEVLDTTMTIGKNSFRIFPPVMDSFSLTVHLLEYDKADSIVTSSMTTRTAEQIQKTLYKGLAWDLEKWILQEATKAKESTNYDPTRWSLEEGLLFIQEESQKEESEAIKAVNLLLLSGWHSEGLFEELMQYIEPFEDNYCSWYYLLSIAPINSMTIALADLLDISYTNLLVPNGHEMQLQFYWKNALLTLIEPIMEIKIHPTTLGLKNEISTNLTLFQKQKITESGFIIYMLRSQRYPIRINLLFELPVSEGKAIMLDPNPTVLERLSIHLKTSTGKEFNSELLQECKTYKLSAGEGQYQPERELNSRMRRSKRLKAKLESILNYQDENSALLKRLLAEPELLEGPEEKQRKRENQLVLEDSVNDLKLAFEIVDYLQEQELLLNELPPVTKMFKPPENNSLIL